MDPFYIITYIAVNALGFLLGASLAWGLSAAVISFVRKMNMNAKKVQSLAMFLPWRPLIVGLLLLNYVPIFPILWFGFENSSIQIISILSIAHIVFWLTFIIRLQNVQFESTPQVSSDYSWSWVRTLAVFSVILTGHYTKWGNGLMYLAKSELAVARFDSAWSSFWWMVMIALLFDMVIAFGQFSAYRYTDRKTAG